MRVPLRVLFIRVPFYIEDLKRDPDLEKYPSALLSLKPQPNGLNTLKL